jgi:putative transposase
VFITNNHKLAAKTIAEIYKSRWDIELFFKWIKQNLKIKKFYGTSRNAVYTQIWIALITMLLLAFIKFQARFKGSITEIHRLLQLTLFSRQPLSDLLKPPREVRKSVCCQQMLF